MVEGEIHVIRHVTTTDRSQVRNYNVGFFKIPNRLLKEDGSKLHERDRKI
jgi:hypothetical protein